LALPGAALLLSALGYVPAFGEDPVRESIRAVDRRAAVDARIVVLEGNVGAGRQWLRYLSAPARLLNPLIVELMDDTEGKAAVAGYQLQIEAHLRQGKEVWLVGPVQDWSEGRFMPEFMRRLKESYDFAGVDGAPENVRRLRRR
jgi:hypothetical protein